MKALIAIIPLVFPATAAVNVPGLTRKAETPPSVTVITLFLLYLLKSMEFLNFTMYSLTHSRAFMLLSG